MSDLISRSALIEDIKKQYDMMNLYFPQSFISFLQAQPSAEPVRGEWIDTQPEYHHGYGNNTKVCSNCHDYYTKEWEDLYFCPRCGADMRGEKND